MKSLKIVSLILCVALMSLLAVACGDGSTNSGEQKPANGSVVANSSATTNSETASADINSNGASSVVEGSQTASDDQESDSANGESSDVGSTSSVSGATSSQPVIDPTKLTVFVETKQEGNTVTAEVKLQNNPGLTAFNLELLYNKDAVTPNKLTKGLVSVTSNLQQSQSLSGKVTLLYVSAEGFSENGALVTVSFDIKDASKPFDLKLNATEKSFLKIDGETYVVDFVVK